MKRWITKLVVFLLLGAVVNVAVAWGFAIWPIDMARRPEQFFASVQYYEQFGSDRHLYLRTRVYRLPGEIQLSQHEATASLARFSVGPEPIDEADFRALVPAWSRFAAGEPFEEFVNHNQADHGLADYTEYASGWPSYSLRYYGPMYVVRAGSGNVYDESRMTGYFHPTLPQKMVKCGYRSELPFLPIWPGFAINTIFYAAILWTLTLGPVTLRSIVRSKRGLCSKCGYDLRGHSRSHSGAGGEVCPECGATTL